MASIVREFITHFTAFFFFFTFVSHIFISGVLAGTSKKHVSFPGPLIKGQKACRAIFFFFSFIKVVELINPRHVRAIRLELTCLMS